MDIPLDDKFEYPTVDIESGLAIFGDKSTLLMMLENFVQNYMGELLTNIQTHMKDNPDFKELRLHSHKIRGSSSMVGALRMHKIAEALENLAVASNYENFQVFYRVLLEEANNLRVECEKLKHEEEDIEHQMTIIPYNGGSTPRLPDVKVEGGENEKGVNLEKNTQKISQNEVKKEPQPSEKIEEVKKEKNQTPQLKSRALSKETTPRDQVTVTPSNDSKKVSFSPKPTNAGKNGTPKTISEKAKTKVKANEPASRKNNEAEELNEINEATETKEEEEVDEDEIVLKKPIIRKQFPQRKSLANGKAGGAGRGTGRGAGRGALSKQGQKPKSIKARAAQEEDADENDYPFDTGYKCVLF